MKTRKRDEIKISLTKENNLIQTVTLKTTQFILRSLNQLDKTTEHNYYWLLRNPENVKTFRNGQAWDKITVRDFINVQANLWNSGDPFATFVVCDRKTNSFIGSLNISFNNKEYSDFNTGEKDAAELGYCIDQSYWGKGYETQLINIGKLYIQYVALKEECTVKPKNIIATVPSDNPETINQLEKIFYKKETGTFHQFKDQSRALFFEPLTQKRLPVSDTTYSAYGDFRVKGFKLSF